MAGRHSRWAGPLFDGHVCSVGYQVIDWIVEYTCHGIGDIQGESFADAYDLDDEERDHIIEAYRIDEVTGRRLFNEVVYSRPKGRAKSEKAALIVLAEAEPTALYPEGDGAFEFERTASRLQEMRSADWLEERP